MFAIPSIVNIIFAGKEFLIQAIGYILYPNKIIKIKVLLNNFVEK